MQPIARVSDTVFCAADVHDIIAGLAVVPTPFVVTGAITTGSSGSFASGQPIARQDDTGTHAVCPGSNTFRITDGSHIVFDAFSPNSGNKHVARVGDPTIHCEHDGLPGPNVGFPLHDSSSLAGHILTGALTVLSD